MNHVVLVFFAAVHIGHCFLAGDNSKTAVSVPHSHVSDAPLDNSIIQDIIAQETLLRIELQKNVETVMTKFESTSKEIADLKMENSELRQRIDLLNSSCNQGCQNHASPDAVSVDASSSVSDLNTQVRYLTLSFLDLQKQSSVLNDTLQQNFKNVSDNLNTTIRDLKTVLERSERQQAELLNSVSTLERNITTKSLDVDDREPYSGYSNGYGCDRSAEDPYSSMAPDLAFDFVGELSKVGFTASMTRTDTSTTFGRQLVFPRVIVNEGRGYNPSDGVFTAPVGGLYVFYSSLNSYNSENYVCDMVLNGSTKVRLYTNANGNAPYESASNMAVLRLQKGDRIWMKMASSTRIHSDSSSISTFTGYLIHL